MSEGQSGNALALGSVVSDLVVNGLNDKTLERIGGALVVAGTKKVIALIREGNASDLIPGAGGAAKAVTKSGRPIFETIGAGALGLSTGPVGVLGLAVVQMEFALLLKRVGNIERRLHETQVLLEQVNRKLDLGFYSNFHAALDLASSAFAMENKKNRNEAALQAINRLAEARHHYTRLAEYEIGAGTRVAREYLSTLLLAYVAEIRCYLEMGEPEEAMKLLDLGVSDIYPRVQYHVNTLLTSNRSAYLHPTLRAKIDLSRLTRVLRWFNPSLDENSVFEQQRDNFFQLNYGLEHWIKTLPTAIWDPMIDLPPAPTAKTKKAIRRIADIISGGGADAETKTKIFQRLEETFDSIEGMIEDVCRFQAYKTELQAIEQLGIGFGSWKQTLTLKGSPGESGGFLMTALEPLNLTFTTVAQSPIEATQTSHKSL